VAEGKEKGEIIIEGAKTNPQQRKKQKEMYKSREKEKFRRNQLTKYLHYTENKRKKTSL